MPRPAAALLFPLALGLSLSGCNRDRERDGPLIGAEEPTPEATPDEPQKSIFREDVEQPDLTPEALEPLSLTVPFGDAKAAMSEAALEPLRQALASAQYGTGGAIVLRGHTDSAGNDAANLRASRRRAEQVRDWLIAQGVAEDRIVVIAMGEQNPVRPNALADGSANEPGRAVNRRVEVTIELGQSTADNNAEPPVGDAPLIMGEPAPVD